MERIEKSMLRRIAVILLTVISFTLTSCIGPAVGLQSYIDTKDGYQFLYPNGWVEVSVSDGPDVVFRDLIERTENVSVVISPIDPGKTLADLGTPTDVGYRLSKNAIAPPETGRKAELVSAESQQVEDKTYYLLEYAVTLPNQQQRHNLASVAISRGKLYTFNLSTTEKRWEKVKSSFDQAAKSFTVY